MFTIAGVTGHVGSVAAKQLIAKGEKIKVIVRDAAKGAEWAKKGAEVAVGSLADAQFLTGALRGSEGFFALVPPDFTVPDVFAYQKNISDAIASAVKASGVAHVVLLSSVGAHLAEGTGPIKGVHYLENAVRATGAHVTALRPGYFQENAGNMVGPAKAMGMFFSMGPADVELPMIATRDIGAVVAEQLAARPKKNEVIDLHGPSYTNRQVAEKLGALLGKKLQIMEIPAEGVAGAMMQGGIPKPWADEFAEMHGAFAKGIIKPKGDRLVQAKTTIDETLKSLV